MLRKASPDIADVLFRRQPHGLWHRWDAEPVKPSKTAKHDPLPVFVNDGRWIICCPCGGAQLAVAGQAEMFCVDCLNVYCGGLWRHVVWPRDAAVIDEVLSARPDEKNRQWEPGETVKHLRDENKKNGVR